MKRSLKTVKAGARESGLSKIQTEYAFSKISKYINVSFETAYFSSPGDRDLKTDLKEVPGDFFTRDLDEALISGSIDCALHSAKDLAYPVREGLDWFWLPWKEDPGDVFMLPEGLKIENLPKHPRIGVSSERREKYALSRFPEAKLLPIRGTVPSRIEQLDNGDFDAIITAKAAIARLGMEERITEHISIDELPVPEGQGVLALTFRRNDSFFMRMRSLFIKPVVFAGAGAGKDACSLSGARALRICDICLHDTLIDKDILKETSPGTEIIDVGKRCGIHTKKQDEINRLLSEYARRGKRVVRLKGGDPGMFGRLAEEVEYLGSFGIPYRVIPGISSLNAATTATGMLLTRRGISNGFCVMTPRKKGGGMAPVSGKARECLPIVFFMSVSIASGVIKELLEDGFAVDTKAAFVFNAGYQNQSVIHGTLSDIARSVPQGLKADPGLFIVGDITGFNFRDDLGALSGKRVLITSSETLREKAEQVVLDLGGKPVSFPLIRVVPETACARILKAIEEFDWLVLTSPSSVRIFFELYSGDIRSLPGIISCGPGTTLELLNRNIRPEIQPRSAYNTKTLISLIKEVCSPGSKLLRLRSDRAGGTLSGALKDAGFNVTDSVLYKNEPIGYNTACPESDAVFFASTSAVDSFISIWGEDVLREKTVCCIGISTADALKNNGVNVHVMPEEATVTSALNALASFCVNSSLENLQ